MPQELVKEVGMQFSTQMVLSLLDKTKTHTRREGAELKLINENPNDWKFIYSNNDIFSWWNENRNEGYTCKSRYKVGEIIYIKETHMTGYAIGGAINPLKPEDGHIDVIYKADYTGKLYDPKWQPSMFMKKIYSRPNRYEIISVRPQRINTMTDDEAFEEGMNARVASYLGLSMMNYTKDGGQYYLRIYEAYWDYLNAKSGKPFSAGMWVFDYGLKELEVK